MERQKPEVKKKPYSSNDLSHELTSVLNTIYNSENILPKGNNGIVDYKELSNAYAKNFVSTVFSNVTNYPHFIKKCPL